MPQWAAWAKNEGWREHPFGVSPQKSPSNEAEKLQMPIARPRPRNAGTNPGSQSKWVAMRSILNVMVEAAISFALKVIC